MTTSNQPPESVVPTTVAIVRTGVANVASVTAAFERLGARVELVDDAASVQRAGALVLPGVGAFAAGRSALEERGLVEALTERIDSGLPTLSICLGMQLLARFSDEAPGVPGLGVLPGRAQRMDSAPRLPHFGWNAVRAPTCTIIGTDSYYFAHTYALQDAAAIERSGWSVACTTEGAAFVSAVERGSVVACQFHPELSGTAGTDLLRRWLARATSGALVPNPALSSATPSAGGTA